MREQPAIGRGRSGVTRAAAAMLLLTGCASACRAVDPGDSSSPLHLEQTIALPGVVGRIDHLAVDPVGKRLLIAEVANGSVEVIDIVAGRSVARIGGLHQPQGIAWLSATGEFVVACGDGTVHFYSGADNHQTATLDLGDDADDVRLDSRNGKVVIGYGGGGLAVIDPVSHRVVSQVRFEGHPEGFELSAGKAWVNDPDDGAVLAVDLDRGQQLARWPTGFHRLNFPMAEARDGAEISIAYRLPAALARIDTASGKTLAMLGTCGDADDLFVVGERTLVVCGEGYVDVVEGRKSVARVTTRGGARTGLYVPALGSLFVALPSGAGRPAEVWGLRLAGAAAG